MSKVIPVNRKIIIERNDKVKKGKDVGPFSTIVSSNNLGTVKYSSNEGIPVGTSVYYGGAHETLLIEGSEVLAMAEDNLIAFVVE